MKLIAEKARENNNWYYVIPFDLEKALRFPILTVSIANYKKNLYVYNVGCHELYTSRGFLYIWGETVASRGSQKISSCVFKHLSAHSTSARHIIDYSDSCTDQNRNIKMVLMLMHFVTGDTPVHIIDHKFMVSGHSFLPNDADFGSIETATRRKEYI